jgi:anti-sigma factor RsiW
VADPTRPAFARSFPRDPELDALVAAFVRGDYARVRSDAPELARKTDDVEIRDAARQLRRRVDPDPMALLLVGLAALLLLVLSGYYWTHKQIGR